MRQWKRGAIFLIGISMVAACAASPPPLESKHAATPEEIAMVRQTLDGTLTALNARDLNALVAYYANDAKIDSLAAGGKVSRAQYQTAMGTLFSGSNPPRVTGGESTIAFSDATHATARRDVRFTSAQGNTPYRLEYRLEKLDGRWLITQQDYLR